MLEVFFAMIIMYYDHAIMMIAVIAEQKYILLNPFSALLSSFFFSAFPRSHKP